ncbi:hypothetical protein BGX26_005194, partial [Mortierella sp. AD094]
MSHQDLNNYLNNVEGLKGVELCQLGSFLKTSEEDSLLGNLCRMTTKDGYVKWVCCDYYRAGYQDAHTQKLRNMAGYQEAHAQKLRKMAGYQEAHTQRLRDVVRLAGGKLNEQSTSTLR